MPVSNEVQPMAMHHIDFFLLPSPIRNVAVSRSLINCSRSGGLFHSYLLIPETSEELTSCFP